MEMRKAVLPKLLVASGAYMMFEGLLGATGLALGDFHRWGYRMWVISTLAERVAMGVLCFVLADVATDYYGKAERLPRSLRMFDGTVIAYCAVYAVNYVARTLHMAGESWWGDSLGDWVMNGASLLGFLPFVILFWMLKDLLKECLQLRDETSLTV